MRKMEINPDHCTMSHYWALLDGGFSAEVDGVCGTAYRVTWRNELRELCHVWLTGPITPRLARLLHTQELCA